ncbi:MAG: AAA family ATPase [Bacteroidetes bacterium]|nr:AAA family ATPase [Bacteroidota bacterium]
MIQHLRRKEIIVIIGVRQVGKTTVIKDIQQLLEAQGEKTLYL